jgi:hypothetical protein
MRTVRAHPWIALCVAVIAAAVLAFLAASLPMFRDFFGQVPTFVAPLAGWVALFPNEAKKLGSEVAGRTLYWTHKGERLAVAAGLEADFAIASKGLNDEAPGAISLPGKVQWRRGSATEPELIEGQVIVKLKDHRERTANLVSFALAQAVLGSLHHVRPHLDRDVSRAADFALARRMLNEIDEAAAHRLIADVCLPECHKSTRLAHLVDQTQLLDERGLFTRIAIREFVELGTRQGTGLPSSEAAEESVRFVEYLHRIAVKGPHEQLDDALGFVGRYMKVGVVLVARPDVMAAHGNAAYTKRVGEYAKSGVPVVYLAARGTNVEFARQVAAALHTHGNVTTLEEFDFETTHNGVSRPTYLARVTVNIWLSRRAERRFTVLRQDPKRVAS